MDNWAVREQARVKRTKLTIQVGYKYNTSRYKILRVTEDLIEKERPYNIYQTSRILNTALKRDPIDKAENPY